MCSMCCPSTCEESEAQRRHGELSAVRRIVDARQGGRAPADVKVGTLGEVAESARRAPPRFGFESRCGCCI